MTDTPTRVRFPCEEHGVWFKHMVKPVGPKPAWCEGGTTKLLRKTDTMTLYMEQHADVVWVDVTE